MDFSLHSIDGIRHILIHSTISKSQDTIREKRRAQNLVGTHLIIESKKHSDRYLERG